MSQDECARYRPLLPALAGGELDDAMRQRAQEHLHTCQECRAEARSWAPPEFGRVRMPDGFWREREEALVGALTPARPAWQRLLQALLRPLPVPRAVAFAAMLALVWLAGRELVPAHVPFVPRPMLDFEALSRTGSDVG